MLYLCMCITCGIWEDISGDNIRIEKPPRTHRITDKFLALRTLRYIPKGNDSENFEYFGKIFFILIAFHENFLSINVDKIFFFFNSVGEVPAAKSFIFSLNRVYFLNQLTYALTSKQSKPLNKENKLIPLFYFLTLLIWRCLRFRSLLANYCSPHFL